MKILPALVALLSLTCLHAEPAPQVSEIEAADEARIAAMKSADAAQLNALLSDALHYSHSSGVLDTKASLIEALTTRKLTYREIRYEERQFSFPSPDIALMSGKATFEVSSAKGDRTLPMAFLGVWRKEDGQWRFLAWQSCRLESAP